MTIALTKGPVLLVLGAAALIGGFATTLWLPRGAEPTTTPVSELPRTISAVTPDARQTPPWPAVDDAAWRDGPEGLRVAPIGTTAPPDGDALTLSDGLAVDVDFALFALDGTLLDSTWRSPAPIRVTLGAGVLLRGLELGLVGLRVGDRVALELPAPLAFGSQGRKLATARVPPDARVRALVHVVAARAPRVAPQAPPAVPADGWSDLGDGLRIASLAPGEGDPPAAGAVVSLDYSVFLADGTAVSSTLSRGEPVPFPLGKAALLPGVERAVLTMRPGGRALVEVPPALGAGERGLQGVIPPGATLLVEVQLVAIAPPTP
jgi:FKBP-type peptidyl-prolyl cis-trans isomerase